MDSRYIEITPTKLADLERSKTFCISINHLGYQCDRLFKISLITFGTNFDRVY